MVRRVREAWNCQPQFSVKSQSEQARSKRIFFGGGGGIVVVALIHRQKFKSDEQTKIKDG